jgi:hypothetical protein
MGHHVDQEMANSQRGTDLETKTARQSHYIKLTRIMEIPDTCGPHKGYQRIMNTRTKWTKHQFTVVKTLLDRDIQ